LFPENKNIAQKSTLDKFVVHRMHVQKATI
jgi:hypothetical protein